MPPRNHCSACGRILAARTPQHLCASCLLRVGLTTETEVAEMESEDLRSILDGSASPLGIKFHRLGDYELIEEIGRGGMGVVFRAWQINLNRIVALKLMNAGALATPAAVQRFQTEAKTAAGLVHPNIVTIFEIGESQGHYFYSMEWVEGANLSARLAGQALPCREAAQLVVTIAQAVHYAHQRGILHRDLKPSNILLGQNQAPQLADFGLAKMVQANNSLTQTYAVMGTPAYMAPEQARGETAEITTATDIYGLGAILYETLTGTAPFLGGSTFEIIQQVLAQEPKRPTQLNLAVDRDLETICLKCLEKEPSRRYHSAGGLAVDLGRWLRHETIMARRATPWQRIRKWGQRRPAIAALSAGLLMALILGAIGITWQWRQAETSAEERRLNLYAADMNLAYQAWESGNVERARDLLEANRPNAGQSDLRSFDWRYLYHLTREKEQYTLRGPSFEAWGSALAPKGRWLATGTEDGKVRLWDLEQRRITQTLAMLDADATIYSVAFSPGGQTLAAASTPYWTSGGDIYLWDTTTWQVLDMLKGHQQRPFGIAFSPDGHWLVSTAADNPYATDVPGEIWLWDLTTRQGRALPALDTTAGFPHFAPDGRQFVIPLGDGSVSLWDFPAGTLSAKLAGHRGLVLCARFSQDGNYFITGGVDGFVLLWNRAERRLQRVLGTHGGSVNAVAFSPDHRYAASVSTDHTAKLWDVQTGEGLATLKGHRGRLCSVHFTPDGRQLITGSLDGSIKIWPVPKEADSSVWAREGGWFEAGVQYSPDDRWLVCSSTLTNVILWEMKEPRKRSTILAQKFAISPDSQRLVCVNNQPEIQLWDLSLTTPKLLRTLPTSHLQHRKLIFSPSGKYLLSGTYPTPVVLWDTATWREIRPVKETGSVIGNYAFSPDDQWLAISHENGDVRLWRMPNFQAGPLLSGHKEAIHIIQFSANGRWLASGSQDTRVLLWDMRHLDAPPRSLRGDAGAIWSLAFTHDSKILAVGSHEGLVKLWQIATAREITTFKAHRSLVSGLDFSSGDQRLATISMDQTLRLLEASGWAETDRLVSTIDGTSP
jgi:eukaryotic-like serine/threonine-protein kinase